MHRLMLLAVLAVAACVKPATETQTTYRDAGLNLYSNAVFDAARLEGTWAQVAAFTGGNAPDCGPGAVSFSSYDPAAATIRVDARLCLSGEKVAFGGPASFTAPGRMVLSGADPQGIGQAWWVVWVDTDYRTLVIGTPSGQFGFILNRDGALPQDRMIAAQEILDWNGYDVAQLKRF